MKAIMVMFDSLNRRLMQPYGGDWVDTPNFARLAERAVTFENAFIGSMPCMPARRELHTGRYNFLHRSWGPLEPFDDSMPRSSTKTACTRISSPIINTTGKTAAPLITRASRRMNSCAGRRAIPGRASLTRVSLAMSLIHMDANVYKIKSIAAISPKNR